MKHDATGHVESKDRSHRENHYPHLMAMAGVSFIAMYILMYAMVNASSNAFNNLNQVYMAGLMTGAMVIIELVIMRRMYHDRRANVGLGLGAAVLLAACWFAIREQAAIGDRQFLRSMIPHHAGAILMCEQAPLSDASIRDLCQQIIKSQQAEIDLMKGYLARTR
jgi:uncharacterized protein (DUF305 family)